MRFLHKIGYDCVGMSVKYFFDSNEVDLRSNLFILFHFVLPHLECEVLYLDQGLVSDETIKRKPVKYILTCLFRFVIQ